MVTSTSFTLACFFVALVTIIIVLLAGSIRVVQEEKRLSVYRLGRYIGEKGPGLVLLIPIIDRGVVKEIGGGSGVPSAVMPTTYGIIGSQAVTQTTVFTDGKVVLGGREWDAVSQSPIAAGESVRVIKMILEVDRA